MDNFEPPRQSPLELAGQVAIELVGKGAQSVVLVGSHARGDAQPESDLDVLALGDGPAYRLVRRGGWLLSISWLSEQDVRDAFHSPRQAPGAVPGWRGALLLDDHSGVAAELQASARSWSWFVVGDNPCDRYVAGEIAGLAEEVHKLWHMRRSGNMTGAAVQRSILSFRLGVVMAVHHRILFDSENLLWDLVNAQLGPGWALAQSRAFGLGDESFDDMCRAVFELYRRAADLAKPVFDREQREVVRHALALVDDTLAGES